MQHRRTEKRRTVGSENHEKHEVASFEVPSKACDDRKRSNR
ncbi:hypothetical protein [Crocosphaera sp.]|nr:hypothetical protein [Crocosphaera sp.]